MGHFFTPILSTGDGHGQVRTRPAVNSLQLNSTIPGSTDV